MIWRRLLIKDTTSILELHGIIQLLMGWEDIHLHSFTIYNEEYGVSKAGGTSFTDDPASIQLKTFQFQEGDKFLYDYNFFAHPWRHYIRIEKITVIDDKKHYPVCIAGKNACPPEEIESIAAYIELCDLFHHPMGNLLEILEVQDTIGYAWHPHIFKKQVINEWLAAKAYTSLKHNDPLFPDRSGEYFQDAYWYTA